MLEALDILQKILLFFWQVIKWTWWIFVPIILFINIRDLWISYVKSKFLKKVEYTIYQIKIPRYIEKSFKSMEDVFSAFHSIQTSSPKFKDRYLTGKVQLWLSFEIVGDKENGATFYIRTPNEYKYLVESQLYAQYPDLELVETNDYVSVFSSSPIPNDFWDIWGTDFGLIKPSPFPILTYPFFESPKEEKTIDPLSNLLEIISKLKTDERIWIQILFKPAGDSCVKEGESIVNKMIGKKEAKSRSLWSYITEFFINFIKAPFEPPTWSDSGGSEASPGSLSQLTPGEKNVIEAIQHKISKLLFDTTIRVVYVDRKDSFSRLNISSIMGFFRQFNTLNLNGFKPVTSFKGKWPFKKQKEVWNKTNFYKKYMKRGFNSETKMVLNTEELATIFHFPSNVVKAPVLRKIEAKKGEPPANLPTIE